jgi:hypothetical protein
MDKFNMDDLLGDKKGYNLKQRDLFEWLMTQTIATTLLVSETLRRQIELEQLIRNENVDDEIVNSKMKEITDFIAEEATKRKNSTIADLFIRNKED